MSIKLEEFDSVLVYLASPYNHPDELIRQVRFRTMVQVACSLLHCGIPVYSPIVHNHPLIKHKDLGRGWEFWKHQDETILSRCDELWVVKLEGWKESVGVKGELDAAKFFEMPIKEVRFNEAGDVYVEEWTDETP